MLKPFLVALWLLAVAQAPQTISRSPQSLPAPTIHVDTQNPTASDANPGSQALPLKTIGRAEQIAAGYPAGGSPMVILVHPGIYRETVTVTKPMVLVAQPQTEIRGSNVWTAGWSEGNGYWMHPGVPASHAHGNCARKTDRCLRPEQVFYDGRPLAHVAGNPASGQFAVSPDRILILADSPQGHVVEVTVRTRWIVIKSSGVTIRGFRMRHASNDSQSGAIHADSYSNITVESNVLSDVHGAVVSLSHGSDLRIIGNDISRGGQLGIHMSNAMDSIVQHNRIHDNNTEAFSSGWEAGGLKAARAVRLTMDANEVYANDGPGLWCDIECQDAAFSNNRVHDNNGAGIQYEISHRARIFNNVVWKNGLVFGLNTNHWGWGAGILVQNSDGCEVYKNTLAWNSNGIVALEQDRGATHFVSNTSIHDNIIVAQDAAAGGYVYALAWLSDHVTQMFTPPQRNTGWSNKYGYSGVAEPGRARFAWGGHGYSRLEEFNNTSGERQGAYLTQDEQNSTLSTAHVPLFP